MQLASFPYSIGLKKLYVIDYAITVVLMFSPLLPSTQHPPLPQTVPTPLFKGVSSLATPFPILYFTSPWLFCNYLFVLPNPLTSHSFSHTSPPISLSLTFGILIMMCLEVDLFASSCLGLSVLLGFACLFPSLN